MNQLTLFNAYATCRDFMEDARVAHDMDKYARYQRLAEKIGLRFDGKKFCPICGKPKPVYKHWPSCAREMRYKALRTATIRAAAISPTAGVQEVQARTGLDRDAAADMMVDIMEWVS
jgi:hypothetical protein